MIRRPAARMRRTDNPDTRTGRLWRSGVKEEWQTISAAPEPLNRCLPVTDKGKSAWQKRAIRCKGAPLKSVCRELPRVALVA